jgi:uncharacterized membrane protein YjjP (DUF1212 family)
MKKSGLFELPTKGEWLKGLYVTVISAVLTAVLQMLTLVPPSFNLKEIGVIAITALLAYLIKTITSNNQGEPLKKDIGGGGIKNPPKP